ncbi:MAG: methyltransferase type 11 [Gemmataceae bacterium]
MASFYVVLGCIALGLAGFLLIAGVLWRLPCRRRHLPCPTWLAWLVELENPLSRTVRASVIVRYLELQPGMKVADVGCGPGRLTVPLAKQVGERGSVIAVDIQPSMLDRVHEKANRYGLRNIRLLCAGADRQELGANTFDRAVMVSVLGEVPDPQAALKQVFNAVRPGGLLLVGESLFDPHYLPRRTVLCLAHKAGWRDKAYHASCLDYALVFEKPTIERHLDS